ncbi:hypothetical protein [Ferrimonas pelagia]|uniref:Uncharacterized protein n=1 Tax=Ferrimonas pelagia TaxID=1177826 RepID=A0ABP9ESD0_9GAMM
MASESEKGEVEIGIFRRFAEVAGWHCTEVAKQSPHEGKPDLKCRVNGELVYFELTEACSEDVAKAVASARQAELPDVEQVKDYTSATYRRKIMKRYAVSAPVELLIYNVGRTILSDEVLIENIKAISCRDKGQFRKVWYFGEHVTEL